MSDEERLAELAEKAKSLVQESRELANAAKAALDEWAVAACPFKVGQECEVPKEAYAHIGKRCVVSKVRGDVAWRDDLDWVVHAIVLRKDGSQSAKTVSWEKWAWEQGNKNSEGSEG